jgi:hypothetical protein
LAVTRLRPKRIAKSSISGGSYQAVREKDQKKARAVSQEIIQLRKQLPEFVALGNIVKHVDLNSPDGREIASIIWSLNQSCLE